MVRLTETAAKKIKETLKSESLLGYSLRIAIVGGGLNGFEYTMSFSKETSPSDKVFESYGIKIVVDATSFVYLDGTTIDYLAIEDKEGFVFIPNRSISLQ